MDAAVNKVRAWLLGEPTPVGANKDWAAKVAAWWLSGQMNVKEARRWIRCHDGREHVKTGAQTWTLGGLPLPFRN